MGCVCWGGVGLGAGVGCVGWGVGRGQVRICSVRLSIQLVLSYQLKLMIADRFTRAGLHASSRVFIRSYKLTVDLDSQALNSVSTRLRTKASDCWSIRKSGYARIITGLLRQIMWTDTRHARTSALASRSLCCFVLSSPQSGLMSVLCCVGKPHHVKSFRWGCKAPDPVCL